jgi:hypothetical protein
MRFFPKGLNPFKIQTRYKLDFAFEFCNSKYREFSKLEQKGNLSHLKLSITMQSLEIWKYPFHILQV